MGGCMAAAGCIWRGMGFCRLSWRCIGLLLDIFGGGCRGPDAFALPVCEIWAKIPGSAVSCPIEILLWARIGKFPCVLPNFNLEMKGCDLSQGVYSRNHSNFLLANALLTRFLRSNGKGTGKIGQRKPANGVISLSSAQAKICFGHR